MEPIKRAYKYKRNFLCYCGSGIKYKRCCLKDLCFREQVHIMTKNLQDLMAKQAKEDKQC